MPAGLINRAKCGRQQIRKECLGIGRVRRHHYPLRRRPLGFPGGKRRHIQGTMPLVVMLNDLLNTNDAFEVAKKTLEALAEPSYGSCRSASRDSRCRARSSRTADRSLRSDGTSSTTQSSLPESSGGLQRTERCEGTTRWSMPGRSGTAGSSTGGDDRAGERSSAVITSRAPAAPAGPSSSTNLHVRLGLKTVIPLRRRHAVICHGELRRPSSSHLFTLRCSHCNILFVRGAVR